MISSFSKNLSISIVYYSVSSELLMLTLRDASSFWNEILFRCFSLPLSVYFMNAFAANQSIR